jgi:N-methylhydantoinase A
MAENNNAGTRLGGYAIGVDIGGTFTDCVVVSPDGTVTGAKAPTTPSDRSVGFFDSIGRAAEKLGMTSGQLLGACERLVHGTTTGTNAIVSRDGARTGLIATSGHRDIMFLMGGGGRTSGLTAEQSLHVPSTDKPEPLVPKKLVVEVAERIDVDGEIVVPLDEEGARNAIRRLVEDGVDAIAVSLLWSIKNDAHELRVKELVREIAPAIFVTCASELISQVGEYERTTTAVMNAYIGPLMTRYITSIERGAASRGYAGRVLFAQCAGGAITGDDAKLAPIRTVNSGPVAGVVSSELLSRRIAVKDVLLADMGGTTFDVSVIRDSTALRRSTSMFQRYELALPMLDIESVGAGGGSIAWIDESGRLNVGPKSAGAFPGPACYGTGGTEATVTDSDVVLGFIDPANFLEGRMAVDVGLAIRAIERVADPLGLSVHQAAAGIARIVDSKMADLIRRMSVMRGLDPRRFALFAFGGGGPVHAASVAREAGIKHVIVPMPSIAAMWSALGAALADVTYVYQQPCDLKLPIEPEELNDIFGRLEQRAATVAAQQDLAYLPHEVIRSARMKYGMQVHDVEVPVPGGYLGREETGRLDEDFHQVYESIFGQGSGYRIGGTDITSLQVRFTGLTTKPDLLSVSEGESASSLSRRPIYWSETGTVVDTPVVRSVTGVVSERLQGPALVEMPDTVAVIRPGMTAESDKHGNLVIDTGV